MIETLHYDVFTSTPGSGNPAGVVLDADQLTES
ncbi:PhzF family phenazine biosynthesis protein, partial [Exiguobacterium sp. UBA4551]